MSNNSQLDHGYVFLVLWLTNEKTILTRIISWKFQKKIIIFQFFYMFYVIFSLLFSLSWRKSICARNTETLIVYGAKTPWFSHVQSLKRSYITQNSDTWGVWLLEINSMQRKTKWVPDMLEEVYSLKK